jgi:hypothetical protein
VRRTASSTLASFSNTVQWLRQWWAPQSAEGLQKALSQLRSLSIPDCHEADAPALLGALATSCTQLTRLELRAQPMYRLGEDNTPALLRGLDQLSSPEAFPALQELSVGMVRHTTPEVGRYLTPPGRNCSSVVDMISHQCL